MKLVTTLAMTMAAVAGGVTWLLMFRASGWHTPFDWFVAWALSPYLVVGCYALLRGQVSPAPVGAKSGFWACLAALLVTLVIYLDASFVHVSSTSALAFLFGPLWVAGAGLLVGEVFIHLAERKAANAR